MRNNESKFISASLIILLIILSGFGGYSLGINNKTRIIESNNNVDSTLGEMLNDAVVLSKEISTRDGGGATLSGEVRNKTASAITVQLTGYFKTVDNDIIVSATQSVTLNANANGNYSIDFGPEVAGFASFDVDVTNVTK